MQDLYKKKSTSTSVNKNYIHLKWNKNVKFNCKQELMEFNMAFIKSTHYKIIENV